MGLGRLVWSGTGVSFENTAGTQISPRMMWDKWVFRWVSAPQRSGNCLLLGRWKFIFSCQRACLSCLVYDYKQNKYKPRVLLVYNWKHISAPNFNAEASAFTVAAHRQTSISKSDDFIDCITFFSVAFSCIHGPESISKTGFDLQSYLLTTIHVRSRGEWFVRE